MDDEEKKDDAEAGVSDTAIADLLETTDGEEDDELDPAAREHDRAEFGEDDYAEKQWE